MLKTKHSDRFVTGKENGFSQPMRAKLLATSAALILIALPSAAQSAAEAEISASVDENADKVGRLEEIVVTGTKRSEAMQDVPISISALSGQTIKNTFRTDIAVLGDITPGVSLGNFAGFRAVAGGIRGTGSNSILTTQDSSVVVLVDEFALSSVASQFIPLFDVERVEVYRGPQGTLFGKSATGGAISIVTKRPVLNRFSGEAAVTLGRHDNSVHGTLFKGQAALNIPIVEDKLAVRMTIFRDYDQGYYRNDKAANSFPVMPILAAYGLPTNTPLPPTLDQTNRGTGERLGGTDSIAGRIKLLYTPSDNYEVYLNIGILRDRSPQIPGVNESPAIGEIDPGVTQLSNGMLAFNVPQTMLLPRLGFDGIHTTGQGDPFSVGVSNNCFGPIYCTTAGHRVDSESYNLQQTLKTDWATFKLIAGYLHTTELLASTYTGEAFKTLLDASRNTRRKSAQFEFRMSTTFRGPFNFVYGMSYSKDKTNFFSLQTQGLLGLLPVAGAVAYCPGVGGTNCATPSRFVNSQGFVNLDTSYLTDHAVQSSIQSRDTYAAYADAHYDATDKLRFTLGGRFTYDAKKYFRRVNSGGACTALTAPADQVIVNGACLDRKSNFVSRASGFDIATADPFTFPLPDSAFGLVLRSREHWQRFTWRAVVDYHVTDKTMVYASYATGFIPGGYTESCAGVNTCAPYESETNWNAELGLKTRLFDNRMQANLSAFYTRYTNLVRSQSIPFIDAFGVMQRQSINVNAGTSRNIGFEAEVTVVPAENLRVDLNAGYMNHKYVNFVLSGVDLSSLTVPFSPKWKLGGSVTYDVPLGSIGRATLSSSLSYSSSNETAVFNSLYTQTKAHTLWDMNATWNDLSETFHVTAYVKNMLNEQYRVGASSVANQWNFTNYARPREFGMEFGVKF